MTFSIAHSQQEFSSQADNGSDIIIIANRLFGFKVVTTTSDAMMLIFSGAKWETAELARISVFFIPIMTLEELKVYISGIIKSPPELT